MTPVKINDKNLQESSFFEKGYESNAIDRKCKQFYLLFGQMFEVEATYRLINLQQKGCFPLSKKLSKLLTQVTENSTSTQDHHLKFWLTSDKVHATYLSILPFDRSSVLVAQYSCQFNNAMAVMDRAIGPIGVYSDSIPVARMETALESFSEEFTQACDKTTIGISRKRKELPSSSQRASIVLQPE